MMREKTKIQIIGGAKVRIGRIGVVSNAKGAGKNLGKVEIYIDHKGHFWYDPTDLKVIEEAPQEVEEEKFTVGFYVETKLTVVETEVKNINSKLNWLFGAVFAVGASILAALYAQPILTALSR